ncbi:MAG TPA: hypothetical protein VJA27_00920 [Patescibacteria group bacterium]|nr:hypothetical protein [Patescibacteria group bacterium]
MTRIGRLLLLVGGVMGGCTSSEFYCGRSGTCEEGGYCTCDQSCRTGYCHIKIGTGNTGFCEVRPVGVIDTNVMCGWFNLADHDAFPPADAGVPPADLVVIPVPCKNGLKDGDESDVDCGGPNCPRCTGEQTCTTHFDCASGTCDFPKGTCIAVPTCTDGMKNGSESDVDCGWPCPDCADGKACLTATDCASGVCTSNICQAPKCGDGIMNGAEQCDSGGTNDCTGMNPCTSRCTIPITVVAKKDATSNDGNVSCTMGCPGVTCNLKVKPNSPIACPMGTVACNDPVGVECSACYEVDPTSGDCQGRPAYGYDVTLIQYCEPQP